ncbi:hypothetical protein [Xanthobacter flavus]|uniref:hypothetical protein n=1 Tax=Xanthobacter flavus TaxID=281 RepID=UPI00372961BB
MKLSEWIKANGESYESFGKRIGKTRQAVHRYCAEMRIPRPADMAAITAATDGAVTVNDFYGTPAPGSLPAAEVA